MSWYPRESVMGLPLDLLTMDESVQRCLELIAKRNSQHVVLNAAKVVMAHDDARLHQIIDKCPLINADGQSIVWASRLLGISVPERVAGIDLMHELVDKSSEHKLKIYLLGAKQEVVDRVASSFKSRGAVVVGARNGFWDPEEESSVVAEIAVQKPDILFVAIPSPRKEKFLAEWILSLNVGLAFGVGGSFDVVAGATKRAPLAVQRLGLEWGYRLLQEPRRLSKRYFVGNSRFIWLLFRYRFNWVARKNV